MIAILCLVGIFGCILALHAVFETPEAVPESSDDYPRSGYSGTDGKWHSWAERGKP